MNGQEGLDRWFDLSLDMLCVASFDGFFKRVNHAWPRTLGWTAEELLSRPYLDFVHPEDRQATIIEAQKLVSGGFTVTFENRYRCKDGSYRWLQWNASPSPAERLIFAVARDVSERRMAESMLRVAHSELEQRVQERTAELRRTNAELQMLVTELNQADQALRIKSEQMQAISEAMTQFLETGNWQEASARLLRAAIKQTQSEYGFIGVVVSGPVLRILAYEGLIWDQETNRDVYEQALRTYQEVGYFEFRNLKNLFGTVITTARTVLANDPGRDVRSGGLPPGHPPLRHFLGVPVRRKSEVVGMIGVANRPGGYSESEQEKLEILMQAAGVLYDSYRRRQRESELEEQLCQAQKMEAIGRLAGGIAHDFNNLLLVITGFSELLLNQYRHDDQLCRKINYIKQAGDSAAALTEQLLAFSRKQVLVPKVLDLNAIVVGMSAMLQRLLGEDIELATVLDPALGSVKADPSQLEQVLMNLAANARDAMPDGGRLTIGTANVEITGACPHGELLPPGRYAELTVNDTGVGMDAETQARIFEPFFTTKERGKGTGLGLSTVYGIVKQSGGYIFVSSEPGHGTTFKVYLPRVDETVEAVKGGQDAQGLPNGRETVLLVEDDPTVRSLVRTRLEQLGYTVLEARHGFEALIIASQHPAPIQLLVTDVVMPQMSGRDLADRLMLSRPDIKVLYMSGYATNTIAQGGVLNPGAAFLQKPCSMEALAHKVREVLDSAPSPDR